MACTYSSWVIVDVHHLDGKFCFVSFTPLKVKGLKETFNVGFIHTLPMQHNSFLKQISVFGSTMPYRDLMGGESGAMIYRHFSMSVKSL
jgi:hypothetical protein